jgi:hypothetical protein
MRGFRNSWIASLLALSIVACDGGTNDTRDPAELIKLAGDGQTALTGTTVPESLVVQVLDNSGNGVPGIAVTWSNVAGGGTIAAAAGSSDANGRLAARWTLGSVGPNVALVSAAGFSVSFNAIATSLPPPTNLLAVVAEPATAQSGVVFPTQPTVQLENNLGVPLAQPGVVVTASIATGSGFGTLQGAQTATTNANGLAAFNNLSITGPVGNYTLGFSATGFTATTSSTLSLSTVSGRVPLTDMGNRTYQGFSGGLYAGGNSMPAAHAAAGAARARNVVPRDTNGNLNANGKIVMMSIGMSNTTQEWCNVPSSPCTFWSFSGQAAADNAVDHTTLEIVDGARGGQTAVDWANPATPNYDRIRDSVLAPLGLTEKQVQVIWLKVANSDPTVSLPSGNADAILLLEQMGDIARVLANRYPSLQIIFVSSRIYAGNASIPLNPEPYAYQAGFAVKWLIQAQIDQMANGGTIVDNRPGDLNYNTTVPWLAWGAYLWADGTDPRSDGLTWLPTDYEVDGTHPDTEGETKVGGLLLTFFKTDPRAACWFLASGTCP